jgi:hypothetical protein
VRRACLSALLLASGLPALAGAPLTRNEQAVINFGFATQLGSGIYSLSGRTLQVYRLPFAYAPPVDEDARVRPRITLPLTLGFVDFKPRDVVETGVPERIDSLSFVPGLALHIALREDWELEPFVEAGIARDQASEADQNVYAAGLRSRYDFGGGPTDWQLYNELVHVVVEQDSLDRTDDFTRFRIGTTARRPFDTQRSDRRADFESYGLIEVVSDPPGGPASSRPRGGEAMQYEVGFTLGATEPLLLWRIKLPRVGFGYRFGEGLSVYRIVFGSPY